MRTFRKGGVHPPEHKITASGNIIEVELPREVVIDLSQSIGAPAVCVVGKGDHVERGALIGEAHGFVSANVHTPISGMVTRIGESKNAFGMPAMTVTIAASDEDHDKDMASIGNMTPLRTISDVEGLSSEQIVDIVGGAGIVGLGGAAFPARVKLIPPAGKRAEILIINAVIGIEANKEDAIKLLRERIGDDQSIKVETLRVKYPQGGEKQLIQAVVGREVPSGCLPVDVGVIVQNVATAYAVYEAVVYGKPLIDRIVTVTGPEVASPGNYLVPMGMSMSEVIALAGGVPADTGKVVLGGPLMGRAAVNIDAPTVKGVSGILLLPMSDGA